MAFQSSLGVAVEETAVAIAYLKQSLKRVRVAAQASYPLEEKLSVEERAERVEERLQDFLAEHRVAAREIHLGIPRSQAFLRYLDLPVVVKENLREALGYELERYAPFQASDVDFDYQIIREDKETGQMTVLLLMVKKSALEPFLSLGLEGGRRVGTIGIQATGLANAVARLRPAEGETYGIVFKDGQRLELDLVEQDRLSYSRSVVFPEDDADWEAKVGTEMGNLAERFTDRSEWPLAFVGPEGELERFQPVAEAQGATLHPVPWAKAGLSVPGLLGAYGLALRGLGPMPMDLNLIPPGLRRKASRAGLYVMFVLLGALLLGAVAWGAGRLVRRDLVVRELDREIKRLGMEIAEIDRTAARITALDKQIDFVVSLRRDRISVLDVLKELSETIPKNAWVRNLNYNDGQLQIEGYAESASDLIPLLEESPRFHEVAFLSRITRSRDGKEQFRIGLQVNRE